MKPTLQLTPKTLSLNPHTLRHHRLVDFVVIGGGCGGGEAFGGLYHVEGVEAFAVAACINGRARNRVGQAKIHDFRKLAEVFIMRDVMRQFVIAFDESP